MRVTPLHAFLEHFLINCGYIAVIKLLVPMHDPKNEVVYRRKLTMVGVIHMCNISKV